MNAYRSPEVLLATGMTYRQLDYAVTQGWVTPSVAEAQGSGSTRLFSDHDVYLLRVVAALRSLGIRADGIERVVAYIVDKEHEHATWLIIAPGGQPTGAATFAGLQKIVELGCANVLYLPGLGKEF